MNVFPQGRSGSSGKTVGAVLMLIGFLLWVLAGSLFYGYFSADLLTGLTTSSLVVLGVLSFVAGAVVRGVWG